jgi:ribose-phosphate pyrophosphokinase
MSTPTKSQTIYIASGNTHPALAHEIASALGVSVMDDEIKIFPSGERYFRFGESIRGKHALLIQSLVQSKNGSVNDALLELVLMIDAARRGSASEITVVLPYFAYMRQDRKALNREPISAAAVINILQHTGADRLVSIDMHSAQTQAVFDGPFDHLTAEGIIRSALAERITDPSKFVVVSPDGGRAKSAESYASALGIEVVHIPKSRSRSDSSVIKRPDFVESVEGMTCILIDDLIDTAGTLVSAADTLKKSGAEGVIAAATHGILSGPAIDRLVDSAITELIVTDSTPVEAFKERLGDKLTILSTAPMIASALNAIVVGDSVSQLFEGRNYS